MSVWVRICLDSTVSEPLNIGYLHDGLIWLQPEKCDLCYADLCHARAILHIACLKAFWYLSLVKLRHHANSMQLSIPTTLRDPGWKKKCTQGSQFSAQFVSVPKKDETPSLPTTVDRRGVTDRSVYGVDNEKLAFPAPPKLLTPPCILAGLP